jgi:hypothetical protein
MTGTIVSGFVAGLAGTTAMTATLWLEGRLRSSTSLIDYDASPHVVTAAATALRWTPHTERQARLLFLAVHWGYGSAVGIGRVATGALAPSESAATATFFLGCQAMAMTLFPTLGGTPPPWRWRRDVLISSVAQHAVYAAVSSGVLRQLSRPARLSAAVERHVTPA